MENILTRSRLSSCVGFFCVLLIADFCHAYGGWDYTDPSGQTTHVFKLFAWRFLFMIVLPYECFSFMSQRLQKRPAAQVLLPLLLAGPYIVFVPALSVMGEPGPSHLVGELIFFSVIIVVVLSVIRTAILLLLNNTSKTSVKRVVKVLATIEFVIFCAIITSPLFITSSQFAGDGKAKCQGHWSDSASMQIYLYWQQTGEMPENMLQVVDGVGGDINHFACPVTGKQYGYKLNTGEGGYQLICSEHGVKQYKIVNSK